MMADSIYCIKPNNNMQDIVLKHALKGILNSDSNVKVETLVEILMNTPNPELGIAKLFNEYIEPEFDKMKVDAKGKIYTFQSYDPWTNYISASYQRNKTTSVYVPKSVDKSEVNAENYKHLEVSWDSSGSTHSVTVTLPETETVTDAVSVKTWQSWSNYISEGKQRELDAQNIYC
jgi:hypothetical protein